MDAIQKIKAEIERKQQENLAQFNKGLISIETLTARDSQLLHIRTFAESLEKEPDVDLDFQRFAKEMDTVFALPASQTKNTEEEPLNWEYTIAKYFYELGLNAKSDAPKIKGWVARDRNKALFFHHEKPHRYYGDTWRTDWVMHPQPELHHLRLLDDIMPNLKWEDEPIEVELIIKKV